MMPRPARLPAFLAVLVSLGTGARSSAQDVSASTRAISDIETDAAQLRQLPLRGSELRSPTYVEERLVDGELFFRLRDYVRASIVFTDIVDNFPQHRAYPDAVFLLGESLFHAGDHLGARSRYRMVLDRADEAQFRPHVQPALGRLIEVAIHIRDFTGVDQYFERLSRLPPAEVESATAYFRAKYLYNMVVPFDALSAPDAAIPQADPQKLEAARLAFEAVGQRSPYYAQARYFVGVIYTLRGQYSQAIDTFRRIVTIAPADQQARDVLELAQLGMGRLLYEVGQLEAAIEAYQAVPRTSRYFDSALYEVTWVYIRMGDSTRAERALELLSVIAPGSRHIPDGKLLRGNLLVRDGRLPEATEVFEEITHEFQPVREQLAAMIADRPDPEAYFRELVRENLDHFDAQAFLPPLAARWSSVDGDMQRAVAAVGDLAQASTLIRETSQVAERLSRALGSENPVNVFRDLRDHRQRTVAMRNRLAVVRRKLIEADAAAAAQYNSAELTATRARRREIEPALAGFPVKGDDFERRNSSVDDRFIGLRKQLSELELVLTGLDARIVATAQYMAATMKAPEQQAGVVAYQAELDQQRKALATYREQLAAIRFEIDASRLQVGVGDGNYRQDDALREEHKALVAKERQLLAALGGRSSAQVDALYQRIDATDAALAAHDQLVDQVVAERVQDMRKVLDEESAKLGGYQQRLAELRTETETVVGGVVHENFKRVDRRFYDLVLRADVGIVDVGWAERETHRMRVDTLTRERTRTLKSLDDEFSEIMDERGSP